MADALLTYFRQSLPTEISHVVDTYVSRLEHGEYENLLQGTDAHALLDCDEHTNATQAPWNDLIFERLGTLLGDRRYPEKQYVYFCVGYAALLSFLQLVVTGPRVTSPQDIITGDPKSIKAIRKDLLFGLGSDGIAVYSQTPKVELLCLADAIFTCPPILKNIPVARWAKLRTTFLHQRLLSETSASLQNVLYEDLRLLKNEILDGPNKSINPDMKAEFLLERATVHTYHGFDRLARQDLEQTTILREFQFALTGLLGKRTKFQQNDISQLVVLAISHADSKAQYTHSDARKQHEVNGEADAKPETFDLNDDTLLESITFQSKSEDLPNPVNEESLPESLRLLDPAAQPQLEALDSTILLALASSITNTSPQDGLTREETLPYATRVLEGGSSNWQVYTQGLLVRSRIEGYRSRTVERGLLQLQALVDQVIADTGLSSQTNPNAGDVAPTSFLPRPQSSESAPAQDRLRYIFQLASPTRWSLEAELASRWIELGGLRSALEIYERLEMWAEAALCWAATEREDKARRIVRKQLYQSTDGSPDDEVGEDETWSGAARDPPPSDAPRLYCILGDIDQSVEMYEMAWKVSGQRYARAQRSLGRHYFASKDFVNAAAAYSKSLKANQLNHSSWFALGCALLELAQFGKAAEAFSRCVQLDESDAEAWSNLAAALLRGEPEEETPQEATAEDEQQIGESNSKDKVQKYRQDALSALKRAATLKHDSYRIWQNVLVVSASITPPDYASILAAQRRVIELRGAVEGESCIDFDVLNVLVQHVIASNDHYDPEQPGLPRMVVRFIDQSVVPLVTASAELWRLISKLSLWRNKPSAALDAEEKAWRAVTSRPGWETESEARWNEVVEATARLCDSYESLGPKERTEGMGAGEQMVAKDWKYKARSAVRGIMGRGKQSWDGTTEWNRLADILADLKA